MVKFNDVLHNCAQSTFFTYNDESMKKSNNVRLFITIYVFLILKCINISQELNDIYSHFKLNRKIQILEQDQELHQHTPPEVGIGQLQLEQLLVG